MEHRTLFCSRGYQMQFVDKTEVLPSGSVDLVQKDNENPPQGAMADTAIRVLDNV